MPRAARSYQYWDGVQDRLDRVSRDWNRRMNEAMGLIAEQLFNRGFKVRLTTGGETLTWACVIESKPSTYKLDPFNPVRDASNTPRVAVGYGPSPLLALERARAELDKEATS
jgi:hypothetical protein